MFLRLVGIGCSILSWVAFGAVACGAVHAAPTRLVRVTGHAADGGTGEGIDGLRVRVRVGYLERTTTTSPIERDDPETAGDFAVFLPASDADKVTVSVDDPTTGERYSAEVVEREIVDDTLHVELALARAPLQPGS